MPAAFRLFRFAAYLAFRLGEGVIRILPLDWAFVVGGIGGELAYRILRRRRAVALRNLRLAFAREMTAARLRAINRLHFQLLGANLLAGLKAATLPHHKIWERVTASNIPSDRADAGCIALISHTGNWELYSHLGEQFPQYRFGTVYQPVANEFVDDYLRKARTRSGITLFDRRTQLLSCVRFLREGGVVGVLADQGAGYAGLWTPLFGRLTSSSTLAARLALRTGAPIVPIAIRTCGRARWELTVSDPIRCRDDETELLTAKINSVLEQQIRRSPADWLWAHNRWKPLRPHFLFSRDQRRVFFPPDFDRSALDPFRILIVAPGSPGELHALSPALRAIKDGRPDTSLTMLSLDQSNAPGEQIGAIDSVLPWRRNGSPFSLAAKIRGFAPFDVAIFFAANWRAALGVWLSGIPLRVGFARGLNSWLCNQHPAEPTGELDAIDLNLQIARSVGANINPWVVQRRSQAAEDRII